MDLYQSEFNCIKEEPFDIEIKEEPYLDNETQAKYEERGGKRPHDYTKTFKCTKCDFIFTSDDTIIHHECCNGTLTSSLLPDSKRLKLKNDSHIFVKRSEYDPSQDSRDGSSYSDGNNECVSNVSALDDSDNIDGKNVAEVKDPDINITVKPRFVCSVCGISKSKWEDIKQHTITKKHGHFTSKYRCKACTFNTDIDAEFEIHKIAHKMEVNLYYNKWIPSALTQVPIKCSECEYTSSTEVHMVQHMVIHTSEKPFKCKHIGCNYAAKYPYCLNVHMRTHTGNRLLSCTGCEYKTTQKIKFKVHMKEYHNNFKCQECKRIFNSNDSLEKHALSHKDHSSTNKLECNDDFRNNIEKNVNSHGNINLEDEQFECSLCDYISTSEKDIQEHSSVCNCISD